MIIKYRKKYGRNDSVETIKETHIYIYICMYVKHHVVLYIILYFSRIELCSVNSI